ncbi:MAG: exodeoxyribonuclease III [Gammaproteobacteria bacterium]|nr:exodeoxyribonuclease III [Gammaproteobacteria bacterium]
MRIASWNVNSLRIRLPQVLSWIESARPDVIGLQEIKLPDDAFPLMEIEAAGFRGITNGQRGYNGVALLSRVEPLDAIRALPGYDDEQRRVLAATYDGVRVINLYVPNGQSVDSPKYVYKLAWLEALSAFLASELATHERVAVVGDFNVAPEDRDVHDPVAWESSVLVSEPEREALRGLFALGLTDTFRLFDQAERSFSWWDYRAANFRRNRGLRIDLVLASQRLARDCISSQIDKQPRGWERPSDHTPVIAEFRLQGDIPDFAAETI